jgi:hypothetical protein
VRDEAEHKADSEAVEVGERRCRDAAGVNARRHGTAAISMLLVLLGLVVIARSIQAGVGGGLGLVIGVMLVAAGALRLYLATRA